MKRNATRQALSQLDERAIVLASRRKVKALHEQTQRRYAESDINRHLATLDISLLSLDDLAQLKAVLDTVNK